MSDLLSELNAVEADALTRVLAASHLQALEEVRVHYLGKKGILTEYLKQLGQMDPEMRKVQGQWIHRVKESVTQALNARQTQLAEAALHAQLLQESIDVTLPGVAQSVGSLHPVTLALEKITHYFENLGFSVEDGPEMEDDFHNFEALNIPKHHPARAAHDTFYFSGDRLLRTHTSGVQIRVMERDHQPPYRVIAPGRVYRCDSDVTHTPMFHQVEGLWVDESITFAELMGILGDFLKDFFEMDVKARFRPSYFPFTEPSAEVDVECVSCRGQGCRICKNTGWLEVLGSGMVHPEVLRAAGIDPARYQGIAFGLGVERLAMLKWGISDIRMLYENDIRFLQQTTGWSL